MLRNTTTISTVKPAYSGHLWFLKKVFAITRCPLDRGFWVISLQLNFANFMCFWQLCHLIPAKIIVKLLIQGIPEILDDSLNREVLEEKKKSREVYQIKTFENWITVCFYFPQKISGVCYKEVNLAWTFHAVPKNCLWQFDRCVRVRYYKVSAI